MGLETFGRLLCRFGLPGRLLLRVLMACGLFGFGLIIIVFVMPCALCAAGIYFLVSCLRSRGGNINAEIAAKLAAEDAQLRSQGMLTHFLTTHRAPFVIGFVLPISVIYDAFYSLRSTYIQACSGFPELHQARVEAIQQQVKIWAKSGRLRGQRMVTARPGWLSISPNFKEYKSGAFRVSVPLYDVLEVDEVAQTVRVEPQVSMGQLTKTLLPRGWTLPVVPEMDDLTCLSLLVL